MKKLLYILLFFPLLMFAQQPQPWVEQNARSTFYSGKEIVHSTERGIEADVADWLCRTQPQLCATGSGLELQAYKKSIVGHHLLYQQMHNGVPVYNAFIKVNLSSTRGLLSIFEKTAKTAGWSVNFFSEPVLPAELAAFDEVEQDKVIWISAYGEAIAAWRYDAYRQDLLQHTEFIATPEGDILHRQHLHKNLTGKDTLKVISALVFLPDPLSTANVVYGHDSNWVNHAYSNNKLDSQRVQVFTPATQTDSGYILKSPFAHIKDMNNPFFPIPLRQDSIFHYSRGEREFGAVNSYFHINNFQLYIQSLGIANLGNFPLPVDPHGYSFDQSSFLFNNNNPRMYLGLGGVDDAEDADVVLHEYVHFLVYDAAPNTGAGHERDAIEEGIGDYFACSYSKHYEEFGSDRVFNWDGHNEYWHGRWCTNTKIYPADMIGSIYEDGGIWCAALMNIREEIGREAADKLMLSTIFSFAPNMSMRDAANLLLQSDSLIYNKTHNWPLRKELQWRGFIAPTNIHDKPAPTDFSVNWSAFSSGENYVQLNSPKPQKVFVKFFSVNGKLLMEREVFAEESSTLHLPPVAAGVYVLRVSAGGVSLVEKMVRVR